MEFKAKSIEIPGNSFASGKQITPAKIQKSNGSITRHDEVRKRNLLDSTEPSRLLQDKPRLRLTVLCVTAFIATFALLQFCQLHQSTSQLPESGHGLHHTPLSADPRIQDMLVDEIALVDFADLSCPELQIADKVITSGNTRPYAPGQHSHQVVTNPFFFDNPETKSPNQKHSAMQDSVLLASDEIQQKPHAQTINLDNQPDQLIDIPFLSRRNDSSIVNHRRFRDSFSSQQLDSMGEQIQLAFSKLAFGKGEAAEQDLRRILEWTALAKDDFFGGERHQRLLQTALTAIQENSQLLALSRSDVDANYFLKNHQTAKLLPNTNFSDVQSVSAAYYQVAADSLYEIVRDLDFGSMLLACLGKVTSRQSAREAPSEAQTFFTAALLVDPNNRWAIREFADHLFAAGDPAKANQIIAVFGGGSFNQPGTPEKNKTKTREALRNIHDPIWR